VLLNLQFLGAAGTITGSRYLLEADDVRVLVDCGLFQGSRELRARNWQSMPVDPAEIDAVRPDLVVLSPGPGRPADFGVSATIAAALERGLPLFGVCLGLQGIVEHFGGELGLLDPPMHGKASRIEVDGGQLFSGMPASFLAGRYHSLCARPERLPDVLQITARSDDGVVMAVEHRTLRVAAVQFHPESIMSLGDEAGMRLVANVVRSLR